MSETPLVTVVIPSYNHAQYISNAIESVLNQTYDHLELIVVDDGSSDNSHEVIRRYSDNPKVKMILNSENQGQSAVFNQALAISSGKYVALLPSDDWFLPEKTALQVAKIEASDEQVGVVYAAGARYFEDTGQTETVELPVRRGWIAKELLELGNFIYPITPLYRRSVLERIRPSEDYKAEGEAIHMRIALEYRYEYVDAVVAVMRDHSYNIGKDAVTMEKEIAAYFDWYFALPELPEDIRQLKGAVLSKIHRVKAMQHIFDGNRPIEGRNSIRRALQHNPRLVFSRPTLLIAWIASWLPQKIRRLIK